jgi:predicted nucleic acid-binding protein
VKAFFDTNIIVYAQQSGIKAETARKVLDQGGIVSVQVLNELASVLSRKFRKSWPDVEDALADVLELVDQVLPLTLDTHKQGVVLAAKHSISIYDALIIAAAIDANCDRLFSEDMQHGRKFGGLEIVNPFLEG